MEIQRHGETKRHRNEEMIRQRYIKTERWIIV